MTSPGLQSFTVTGTPVAWQRAGTSRGRFYTKAKTARFEDRVALFAQSAGVQRIDSGPVELLVYAWWPMRGAPLKRSSRPARLKDTRPDMDNVLKAVADALNGVAYRDDGQIAHASIWTMHSSQRGSEHTYVEIRPMGAEEIPEVSNG